MISPYLLVHWVRSELWQLKSLPKVFLVHNNRTVLYAPDQRRFLCQNSMKTTLISESHRMGAQECAKK